MSIDTIENLPKDVLWIILKDVLSDYYFTNKITFYCCSTKPKLGNSAQIMLDLSSVSKVWEDVLKSKCRWHKCGWSFKNDCDFIPHGWKIKKKIKS